MGLRKRVLSKYQIITLRIYSVHSRFDLDLVI